MLILLRNARGLVSAVAGAGLLAGCGTWVDFTATNTPPVVTAPRHAQDVDVYATVPPSVRYVEVGLLEARQQSYLSFDDRAAVLQELRAEAGEHGCDAVVILGTADRVGLISTEDYHYLYTLDGYRASCIIYLERG